MGTRPRLGLSAAQSLHPLDNQLGHQRGSQLYIGQTCLLVSEPIGEKFGGAADIIDFLDAEGFQASFVAGVGVRAKLLDEIGKDHLLAINGEDALVIFTVDTLGLTTGSHLLIYHQAPVQVDSRELGFGIFFGTGA